MEDWDDPTDLLYNEPIWLMCDEQLDQILALWEESHEEYSFYGLGI